MNTTLQENWISRLLRKSALVLTIAMACALSGNMTLLAQWEEEGPPPDAPAVPEVGVWLIGAGVLAMLAYEFLRRRSARKRLQASS